MFSGFTSLGSLTDSEHGIVLASLLPPARTSGDVISYRAQVRSITFACLLDHSLELLCAISVQLSPNVLMSDDSHRSFTA